jgi:hypothetical protein
MIPALRKAYNQAFTQKKYLSFLNTVTKEYSHKPSFRISETPIFFPNEFRDQLIAACDHIVEVIARPDFKELTQGSIKDAHDVPNEDEHPTFLVIDFGVCEGEEGGLSPQMIEMQGFPSLYVFQDLLAEAYQKNFDLPKDRTHLFNGLNRNSYIELLKEIIVGDTPLSSVVLLEVEPEKQATQIDFWGTAKELGIKVLCLSKVIRRGKKLYYKDDLGKSVRIEKIYNRVILDELERNKSFKAGFHFTDDVDVEWIGHPNWFFRISKYTLPFIDSPYVPKTFFLKDLEELPTDLENYVLKPLFSFSGQGVKINVTKADIEAVEDKTNYILQRKVNYVPVLETPNEPAKIEIRMLFVWKKEWERPKLVNNLVRLSKGEMIGVRYNKDKDWVGASVGLFGND